MNEPLQTPNAEQDIFDRLANAGFLAYYHASAIKTNLLTEVQQKEFAAAVRNPFFRAYLQEMAHNMIKDLLRLKFERSDEQLKLAARFARGSGALEVIDQLILLGDV